MYKASVAPFYGTSNLHHPTFVSFLTATYSVCTAQRAMKSQFYLPPIAPPREAIPLGSIIPDIHCPLQDAYPSDPSENIELQEGRDYLVRDQANFGTFLQTTKGLSFKAVLSKLLSASHESEETNNKWLAQAKTRIYELKQPNELWRKLCSAEATRAWLQGAITRGLSTLYFVVSYYTITDAMLSSKTYTSSGVSGSATVPVAEILSAGGVAVASGLANLDVSASARHGVSRADGSTVYTAGERIYALCYRKVTFKWYSPRTVDKAILQAGNRWLMTSDNRGQAEDEEDAEIVEAEIGDDNDILDEEEGDEKFTLGDNDHEFVALEGE